MNATRSVLRVGEQGRWRLREAVRAAVAAAPEKAGRDSLFGSFAVANGCRGEVRKPGRRLPFARSVCSRHKQSP
jgi:hypothetical protein